MSNCFYCGDSFKSDTQSRIKCAFDLCTVWTHETCYKSNHSNIINQWYCTNHRNQKSNLRRVTSTPNLTELPIDNARINSNREHLLRFFNELQNGIDNIGYEHNKTMNDSSILPNVPQMTNANKNKTDNVSKAIMLDDEIDNPFSNFNCDVCQDAFTNDGNGVLCQGCHTTYHYTCLNDVERENVNDGIFLCQHCLQDAIRRENLMQKHRREMKRNNKTHSQSGKTFTKSPSNKQSTQLGHSNQLITETPKKSRNSPLKNKSLNKKHSKDLTLLSSSDSSSSSSSSDDEYYKKKSKKNKKRYAISSSSSSESSDDDSEDSSQSASEKNILVGLYKLTQKERMKSKFEKLPIVDNMDSKWTVFFDLFKQSRKLFCDAENVVRIQNSIKCKEILEIGGINLSHPLTYWCTLKMINKRICRSVNILQKETNEIIKIKKLKYDTENKKILEFIDKIVNYCHIVKKYGKKKHMVDDRVISHIANIMPNGMMHGWHKLKAKLDDQDKTVTIKHIAKYLGKQVSYINSKISAEEVDPWRDNSQQKFHKKPEFAGKRFYQHSTIVPEPKSSRDFCWLHDSKSHSAFTCNKLWTMSGKEVSELAKKHNICTFCGSQKHKDCPNAKNLKCKIEGCPYRHHMLFCYRRKAKNVETNFHKKESHKPIMKNSNEKSNKRITFAKKESSFNHTVPLNHNDDQTCQSEEEDEVIVPQSNFYINQPPSKINVNSKMLRDQLNTNFVSLRNYHTQSSNVLYNQKASYATLKKTSPSMLGVVVIKFVESNTNAAFLMDTGSTVSLIEQKLADELQMNGAWYPLRLNWSGNTTRTDYGSRIIKADVIGLHKGAKEKEIFFRTMNELLMEDQCFDAQEMQNVFPHLNKMYLTSYKELAGVIGTDNLQYFDQDKIFKPSRWKSHVPYGIRSPLGDYVIGNLNQLSSLYYTILAPKDIQNNSHAYNHNINMSDIELKEFSTMESEIMGLDYKKPNCHENELHDDKLAIDLLNKYVRRSENGVNFEAPLLWKEEHIKLPTEASFKIALRRFMIVEKNSLKNGRFGECIDQVQNLLSKGYAEEVPKNEISKINDRTFYIPTFFIQPKNKRTRFIWDAATKVEGMSLNDYLLAGPNLYTNYLKIMFNMREGKYLIKGDIQEMFHRIWMRQEDRDSLRFLFRKSPDENIKVLRMKVMIFGAKSSPTTSQYVKNKIALDFIDDYPLACDIIINSTYVDDVIFSCDELIVGQQLIHQICEILKSGGFNLVKLKSNDDHTLAKIRNNCTPDELSDKKLFSQDDNEKLLGYNVNFPRDEIQVALTFEKIPDEVLTGNLTPTKKQILQLCMSIYDPLGYIEFLLSKFKLIYHWTIKDNYEWSQQLDDKYFAIWKRCISWLKDICKIKIPRLYSHSLNSAKTVQLIGFGDAGTEVLCAIVYMRLIDKDRNYLDHSFICAKSYIVPIKQSRTIPDLELDVACKLAHLMQKVTKFHNIQFNEYIYFTDNLGIKEWIINDARNPKIYVKNRLEKIHKLTKKNEWRWVPTYLQPADLGTKISSMPKLDYNNDWFNPPILVLPEENWPKEPNIDTIEYQTCTHMTEETPSDSIFDFNKYSSLDPLIRLAQRCLKWKFFAKIRYNTDIIQELKQSLENSKTRSQKSKIKKEIKKCESKIVTARQSLNIKDYKYRQIEESLIVMSQKESLGKEYYSIFHKKSLPHSSSLKKLLPYIDNEGMLRAKTRVSNTDENIERFGSDRINPIILPRLHRLTTLIILKFHKACAHHNEKVVILNLLQKYHISKIKRTVNNVIRKECFVCRIANVKPEIPLMGDLPSYRLAFHLPAFTYVIVDLLGPINVKISKFAFAKRYVLVYSCLTTRALHLELIESLEAQATLRALQNTFNLRGVPKRIYSDNGTNFVGGHKILKNCHDEWNLELLKSGIILEPIEWSFSPPRAPHMNGSVERMVGLVKNALNQIAKFMADKHARYDDYGLRAILCEIINMLNSRPLEILPFEDGKQNYLTPNHFIIGKQNAQSVPPCIEEPKLLTQHWEDIKMISNMLWNKWLKAFLPTLLIREKWVDYSRPLAVGDVVVTIDPSIANSWRIGIIEKVTYGSQNQVRQVQIRLGKNKVIDKAHSKSLTQLQNDYNNL